MESNEDSSKPSPFGQVWLVVVGADAADRSFYKIVRPDRWYSRLGLWSLIAFAIRKDL